MLKNSQNKIREVWHEIKYVLCFHTQIQPVNRIRNHGDSYVAMKLLHDDPIIYTKYKYTRIKQNKVVSLYHFHCVMWRLTCLSIAFWSSRTRATSESGSMAPLDRRCVQKTSHNVTLITTIPGTHKNKEKKLKINKQLLLCNKQFSQQIQ